MIKKKISVSLFDEHSKTKGFSYLLKWECVHKPIDIDPSLFVTQGRVYKKFEGTKREYNCILTTNMIILRELPKKKDTSNPLLMNQELLCMKLYNPKIRMMKTSEKFVIRLISNGNYQDFFYKSM